MRNMLEICRAAADIAGIQKPENLFDDDSQHGAVFLSVAKQALSSLLRFGDWQELTKEGCLRTCGQKTSYLLKNIVPDFYALLNNTIYVKDSMEKVIGAITPESWMRQKYFGTPDGTVKFKIQNGMIKFLTPPDDHLKIVFNYRSDSIVYDGQTFEEKSDFTKNSDIPVFDDYLVEAGIIWRLLRRNGMDYAEEFNEYERELKKRFGTGNATEDIKLYAGAFCPADMEVVVNAATPAKPGQ